MITVFDKIREKNRIITRLVEFQNSTLYPILFAVICIISGVSGRAVYLPCIWILTLAVVFSILFSDDLKVVLVPAIMIFFSIGFDSESVLAGFGIASLANFLTALSIMLLALAWRIGASGVLKGFLKKRGSFFWGIVALDAVFILNGVFSAQWKPINLLFGFLAATVLTVFYGIFVLLLENSKNLASYACKAIVCAGAIASAQTIIIVIRQIKSGELVINGFPTIGRWFLHLSWGPPTITAAVIALAIPAALYLARNCRFPVLSCSLSLFFLIMTVIIDTRSAFVCGGLFFLIGIIICCFKNKNKVANRIFAISVFALAAIAITVFIIKTGNTKDILKRVFSELRIAFLLSDNASFTDIFGARAKIWAEGLQNFLSAPVFGAGFAAGMFNEGASAHFMYHNVIVELLASTGVVGVLAFTVHLKQIIVVAFRKFSLDRLIILFVPLIILGMSMLDNFFFLPNFTMIYALFIAIAEIMFKSTRNESVGSAESVRTDEQARS